MFYLLTVTYNMQYISCKFLENDTNTKIIITTVFFVISSDTIALRHIR